MKNNRSHRVWHILVQFAEQRPSKALRLVASRGEGYRNRVYTCPPGSCSDRKLSIFSSTIGTVVKSRCSSRCQPKSLLGSLQRPSRSSSFFCFLENTLEKRRSLAT